MFMCPPSVILNFRIFQATETTSHMRVMLVSRIREHEREAGAMLLPTSSPIQYAEFRLGFLAEPVSVRVARTVVRSALQTWDLDDLIDGSVLVISELVTNGAKAGPGE